MYILHDGIGLNTGDSIFDMEHLVVYEKKISFKMLKTLKRYLTPTQVISILKSSERAVNTNSWC